MVSEYMLGLVSRAGRPAGREVQEGGLWEDSILHLELFSRQARIRRLLLSSSPMDHMEEGRPGALGYNWFAGPSSDLVSRHWSCFVE